MRGMDDTRDTTADVRRQALSLLRGLERRGIHSVLAGDVAPPPARVAGSDAETAAVPAASERSGLEAVRAEVAECTRCALCESRTQTVFGVGDPQARVMFIGEAPGRDEDARGEPFVGRAGQLLNKILAAMEWRREDVYITNILKCRPPNNRDPQESEVRCCEDYLKRQIALIQPRYICALGRIAAQWLLRTNAPLSVLRTGEYQYEGIPVISTYHPAALLRNPQFKKPCWEDMKKLKALLETTQS